MIYSNTYEQDLLKAQKNIRNIEELNNTKVLITGATGMIGSALVDIIMNKNLYDNDKVQVYAAARKEESLKNIFFEYMDREEFHFIPYDANQEFCSEIQFDYIICGASNANPAKYAKEPVETMLTNINGINGLLQHAVKQKKGRVLYISSSEVYGNKKDNMPYSENDYGYIDLLNARACYPISKQAGETLCIAYEKEYQVDTVIVRPGHIYGPTMSESDTRASSQFPKDILNTGLINMKSKGEQLRSYCYVLDCASAIMTVLINGISGEAYNISNKNSIVTIKEMAEMFAEAGKGKIVYSIPSNAEKEGYNMMVNSSLKSDKLEKLGWEGLFSMKEGTEHTIAILKGK